MNVVSVKTVVIILSKTKLFFSVIFMCEQFLFTLSVEVVPKFPVQLPNGECNHGNVSGMLGKCNLVEEAGSHLCTYNFPPFQICQQADISFSQMPNLRNKVPLNLFGKYLGSRRWISKLL